MRLLCEKIKMRYVLSQVTYWCSSGSRRSRGTGLSTGSLCALSSAGTSRASLSLTGNKCFLCLTDGKLWFTLHLIKLLKQNMSSGQTTDHMKYNCYQTMFATTGLCQDLRQNKTDHGGSMILQKVCILQKFACYYMFWIGNASAWEARPMYLSYPSLLES